MLLTAFVSLLPACIQPSGSKDPAPKAQISDSLGGATQRAVSIQGAPGFHYGDVVAGGGSSSHLFTLTNNSSAVVAGLTGVTLSSPFSYVGGSFPGSGGSCTTLLGQSATCTVEVLFAPPSSALYSGTLAVQYLTGTNVVETSSITIGGTGVLAANLGIDGANPFDIGSTPINGGITDKVITVNNTGAVPATAVTVAVTGTGFSSPAETCTGSVTQSCTVTVRYTAALPLGSKSGNLQISYNNGATTVVENHGLAATAVREVDHLTLTVSPGAQPSSTATTGGTFSATVVAVDSLGALADYYNATIRFDAINRSAAFGTIGNTIGSLQNGGVNPAQASMVNGVAIFSSLRYPASGLIKLRPTVSAEPAGSYPPMATINTNTGTTNDSSVVTVDLLKSASNAFYSAMTAYLPFNSGYSTEVGAGPVTFTPNFGFRSPPWEAVVPDRLFSDSFTNAATPTTQCTAWDTFRSGLTGQYDTINIRGSLDATGVTCTGATAAAICGALQSGTSGTWSCGGRTWNVGTCAGGIELSANGNNCSCNGSPAYTVRPCIGNSNWGGVNSGDCGAASQTMAVTCSDRSSLQKDAVVLSENSKLQYDVGSAQDHRSSAVRNNLDLSRGTVAFWIRPGWGGSDTTKRRLLFVENADGPSLKTNGDGKLYAGFNGSETEIQTSISTWNPSGLNPWHHVVYRWDARAPVRRSAGGTPQYSVLSIDGSYLPGRTSQWVPSAVVDGAEVYVGTPGISTADHAAGASIAGFRLDGRAWSDDEVAKARSGSNGLNLGVRDGIAPDTRLAVTNYLGSLVALRPFQDVSTSTTADISIGGTTVTVAGTTGFANADAVWLSTAGALNVPGHDNDDVRIASPPSPMDFGASSFTIEAWIKVSGANDSGTDRTIFRKLTTCGPGGTGGFTMRVAVNGALEADVCGTNSATSVSAATSKTVSDGGWHHVAMVLNRSNLSLKLYIDGELKATNTYSTLASVSPSGVQPYIGSYPPTLESFKGEIDEVRVWDIARSQTELSQNRAHYIACGSDLLFAWGFDSSLVNRCSAFNAVTISVGSSAIVGSGVVDFRSFGATQAYRTTINGAPTGSTFQLTTGPTFAAPTGSFVFQSARAGAKLSLTPGGDFESIGTYTSTRTGAGSAPHMWLDASSAALSGRSSLHLLSSILCPSSEGPVCPRTNHGGVYFEVGDISASKYVLSFDYKVLSGQMAVNANTDSGFGDDFSHKLHPGTSHDASPFVSSNPDVASGHFETVYSVVDRNRVYITGVASTDEFLLDNVKVFPLAFGDNMQLCWSLTPACVGCSCSVTTTNMHGGSGANELSSIPPDSGIESGTFTPSAGRWYVASAWVRVLLQGMKFDVLDTVDTQIIASTALRSATTGYVRLSQVFQARSANALKLRFLGTAGGSSFRVDDVAVLEIDPSNSTLAIPAGALTFTENGAPAADVCDSTYTVGTAPAGRVDCGATSTAAASLLGPGVSCASTKPLHQACTDGTVPSSGSTGTDGAILIDGNSRLSLDANGHINKALFTVSLWAKTKRSQLGTDDFHDSPPIWSVGGFAGSDNFALWGLNNIRALICATGFSCPNGSAGTWNVNSGQGSTLAAGDWVHLVATYDNGPGTGVVVRNGNNGTKLSYTIPGTDFLSGTAGSIHIGSFDALEFLPSGTPSNAYGMRGAPGSFETLDGWVDNFRVFPSTLTSEEIYGICLSEKPPTWTGSCGPP